MSPIIHEAKDKVDVPPIDVPSYVFSAGTENSRSVPQYFDADAPHRNFSVKQAEIVVKRFARGLQLRGLKKNEKVLLFSPNAVLDLYFPVLFWGVLAASCVFTGCTANALPKELAYQIKNSDARLVIAAPGKLQNAIAGALEAGLPKENVFAFSNTEAEELQARKQGLSSWKALWAAEEDVVNWQWKKINSKEESMSTTAVINYSSGTTGLPKGVELSHYNLIANNEASWFKREQIGNTDEGRQRAARIAENGHRWLANIPMYHAFGQTSFCMLAPKTGAKVFIMKTFDLDKYILYNDIYRITEIHSVPTIMNMVAKSSTAHLYNLNSIEGTIVGSSPLAQDTKDAVQKLLRSTARVKQGYGMTEATTGATNWEPEENDDFGNSVGRLYPNMFGKTRPVEGRDFKEVNTQHQVGELLFAGPNIMKGYYKNQKATDETIIYEDGKRWLCTGDVGYFDDTGRLYIVDRIKDLIKVKGLQVAPAEIEQVLIAHDGIADAGVVGFKRNDGYEYPRAFIVCKSDKLSEDQVKKHVSDHLSKHKCLEGGVIFVDELPRNPSGKILRRKLQEDYGKMETSSGQTKL